MDALCSTGFVDIEADIASLRANVTKSEGSRKSTGQPIM
jgi:hypothetical protein